MDAPGQTPRALTHDELKAAEAAFGGRPFNPAWSVSARKVYDGLIQALPLLPEAQTDTLLPVEQPLDEQPRTSEESSETVASDSLRESASEPQEATGTMLSKR